MSFKKGEKVIQVQPKAIEGVVEGFGINQETGERNVRISYTDEIGNSHHRYFKETELKVSESE